MIQYPFEVASFTGSSHPEHKFCNRENEEDLVSFLTSVM